MVVKVIKAENGEGGREASEASKTSEVKAEAKVEDTTKGETVLVDEDLRKLFVGGLAQVSMPVQFNRKFYFTSGGQGCGREGILW